MAPKAEKKPAKKVAKTAKTGAKKKSKAKVESFKIYIYKVLKQVRRLFALWYKNFTLLTVQEALVKAAGALTLRNSVLKKHLSWLLWSFPIACGVVWCW